MIKKAVLTIATASALLGQSAVHGPTVGWVFDAASSSLRSVDGIPGSSIMGRNLAVGFDLSQAAVAPDGRIAIVSAASDGRMMRVDLRSGANPTAIPDVPASADEVVFSPTGSAALLIYRAATKAIVIPSLADSSSASREVHFAGGMPETFAITDDATLLLASSPERLVAIDSSDNRWNVNFEGPARNLAFMSSSHDALVTGARGLWMLRSVASNPESRLVWEGNATHALLAPDRKSALVLTGDQSLVAVNLESGEGRAIDCSCAPQMLARMSESVIRVTTLSDGPMWLLDWNSSEPRTVFVPAEVKSEQ